MRALIVLEQRFARTPDGAVWTGWMYPRPFWARYLAVFDGVDVAARVQHIPEPAEGWQRVDGDGVRVVGLPYYIGPAGYLRRRRELTRALIAAAGPAAAIVLRVPGAIAGCLSPTLAAAWRPYAVEVVGDPHEVFAPGSIRHPLRPLLQRRFVEAMRRQCREASAALYVTERALQARYPCPGLTVGVSDVDLPDESFAAAPAERRARGGPLRVVFVGSLDQWYKGPDVLLRAAAAARRGGLDLHVTLVGDGRCRPALERLAAESCPPDRVRFAGRVLAGGAVRDELDRADLFVLPSRTEGMPRALIEAMARGLPCLGTTVGGVPELLAPEDLVPPGNVEALATSLREVGASAERRAAMAARNLRRAGAFRESVLRARREAFYRGVCRQVLGWQALQRNALPPCTLTRAAR